MTGVLGFTNSTFVQCLEGSREAVNETFNRITRDKRHDNIRLVEYKEIQEREFSDWAMGYIPENTFTQHCNLIYSQGSQFNPDEMSGESIHRLLSLYAQVICEPKKKGE